MILLVYMEKFLWRKTMTKKNLKEKLKKIDMHYIVILIVVAVLFICVFYTYNSSTITKFQNNVSEIKQLEANNRFEIIKTKEGSYIINCSLNKSNLEKESFFNYISGKGEGYKINYIILVKIEGEYYKTKTIKTHENDDSIELSSFVRNKKMNQDSNISLYDVNNQTILEYEENSNE